MHEDKTLGDAASGPGDSLQPSVSAAPPIANTGSAMNKLIEKMAREAGWRASVSLGGGLDAPKTPIPTNMAQLEAFAQAVAKRCAEICMAERVNAEESQSDEDEAYNTALMHACAAILAEFGARQESVG